MRVITRLLSLAGLVALNLHGTYAQTEVPTPANVVCYQEIIGSSSGSYSQVSASVQAWAEALVSALGLTGDLHTYVDWAQVTDRNSFENGCDGPYQTVADVYVHIPTTTANYDTVSAALEAYITANPWTSQNSVSCGARSVVTYLPGCGKMPSAPNPPNPPSNINVCFQEIVGSQQPYAAVSAAFEAWGNNMVSALGLTGDLHTYVDWAQVTDRTGFENGCDGPFASIGDIYVHIPTTTVNYDAVAAALEVYIASHPFITSDNVIACNARSNTNVIPGCGATPTQAATTAPTQAATQAPTEKATEAPTQAPTQAPTEAPTEAPTQAPTQAPTEAPTEAPTQAPTQAPLPTQRPPSVTQAPTLAPSPNNVVCFQEIIGSSSSYADVVADFTAWGNKLMTALSLSGNLHDIVNWAQVTDRTGFENGCDGPYTSIADIFVQIPSTSANYDATSAALEAFLLANPISSLSTVTCSARSVTSNIPTCGKIPTGNNPLPTETPSPANVVCFQEIIGSASSYADVVTDFTTWGNKLMTALSLTGDIHQYINWAQVTDRTGFENGCNGPYTSIADIFVTIPSTSANYDALSLAFEAFLLANPITSLSTVKCGARSVTTILPTCGKVPVANNPPGGQGIACYQAMLGSTSGSWADVNAQIQAWATAAQTSLGLTGDLHKYVDWAQVTDRTSFDTCAGPYNTVADVFIHIPIDAPNYNTIVANVESYTSTHPFTGGVVDCMARSVTDNIPICGQFSVSQVSSIGNDNQPVNVMSGNDASIVGMSIISVVMVVISMIFI